MKKDLLVRCDWVKNTSNLILKYHDEEWGVPLHDDKMLFELLSLEGAQAGLGWSTILNKREGYRKAFKNFDAEKIVKYTEKEKEKLMKNSEIIRNRLKIKSVINNAQKFLEVQKEFGSFDAYIWSFKPKQERQKFDRYKEIPTHTKASEEMSKDLKKRGFTFTGHIVCYAFMQAVGIVNDHTKNCFRAKK